MRCGFSFCGLTSYDNYDKTEIHSQLPIVKRNEFVEIWKEMNGTQKEKLIKNAINKADSFNSICFDKNDSELKQKKKFNGLSNKEKMFKLVLYLNKDKYEKEGDCIDKEKFKDRIFKKLVERRRENGNANFVLDSVNGEIKKDVYVENFFLACMSRELHSIHYNSLASEENELEILEKQRKLKKKNKRKRKKQKKRKSTLDEEEVEESSTVENKKEMANRSVEENEEEKVLNSSLNGYIEKKHNELSFEDYMLINKHNSDFEGEQNITDLEDDKEDSDDCMYVIKDSKKEKSKKKKDQKKTKKKEIKRNSNQSNKQSKTEKKMKAVLSSISHWEQTEDFVVLDKKEPKKETIEKPKEPKIIKLVSPKAKTRNIKMKEFKNNKSRKNTFIKKRPSLIIDSPSKKKSLIINSPARKPSLFVNPPSRKESVVDNPPPNDISQSQKKGYIDLDTKPKKKLYNSSKETLIKYESRVKSVVHQCVQKEIRKITDSLIEHANGLQQAREITQRRINDIVKKTFNGDSISVKEYGSFSTRLLTPYSDLDLSIQGCLNLDKKKTIEMLELLVDNFKLFPFITKVTPILTAFVPVIKLEADPSIEYELSEKNPSSVIIKVDIIVDISDHLDPLSTPLRTTNYVQFCIERYPTFFRNVLLLKFGLNCNNLSNAYNGGLISYGLGILYVAYIESHNIEHNADHYNALLGFLEFYSLKFDFEKQAINFGVNFK